MKKPTTLLIAMFVVPKNLSPYQNTQPAVAPIDGKKCVTVTPHIYLRNIKSSKLAKIICQNKLHYGNSDVVHIYIYIYICQLTLINYLVDKTRIYGKYVLAMGI